MTCLMGDFLHKTHSYGFGMEFYEKVVQNFDVRRVSNATRTVQGTSEA